MSWGSTQQQFYDMMWPYAQQASQATGIDPSVIFAQSALETGWGKNAPGNNYFGIKGPGQVQQTQEFQNGQWVTINAPFRQYSSVADSVQGWINYITGNKRYSGVAGAGDAMAQVRALQNSGYATDPNYADKIGGIIASLPKQMSGGDMASADLPWWQRALKSLTDINYGTSDQGAFKIHAFDSPEALGHALGLPPLPALPNLPTPENITNAASDKVSELLAKLADPLKRAGFVILALVLIAAALFLMSRSDTGSAAPA